MLSLDYVFQLSTLLDSLLHLLNIFVLSVFIFLRFFILWLDSVFSILWVVNFGLSGIARLIDFIGFLLTASPYTYIPTCLFFIWLRYWCTSGYCHRVIYYYMSILVDLFSRGATHNGLWKKFYNAKVCEPKVHDGEQHPHPYCNALRGTADKFINDFITQNGFTPYSVSTSNSDDKAGIDGSHLYYHPIDLVRKLRFDNIRDDHIVKLVDVDYYLSPQIMFEHGLPVISYSCVPSCLKKEFPEGYYEFRGNNLYTYYSGGASYLHPIKNYGLSDTFVVWYWWGCRHIRYSYKTLSDDRRIYFFLPTRDIYFPVAFLTFLLWPDFKSVSNVNVVFGDIMRLDTLINGVLMTSLRPTDMSQGSVEIKHDEFYDARSKFILTGGKSEAVLHRMLASFEHSGNTNKDALRLHMIMKLTVPHTNHYFSTDEPKFNPRDCDYMPVFSNLPHDDGKPAGRQFMAPFYDGCASAKDSLSSDISCVDGRVVKPRTKDMLNNIHNNRKYDKYADEFIDSILGSSAHKLHPLDVHEVDELQDKPSQRSYWQRFKHMFYTLPCTLLISSFKKIEAYLKLGYPRNISPTDKDQGIRYYGFIHPLTQVFKVGNVNISDWYAFSLSPHALVQRMHDLASTSYWLMGSDFTTFDGSVSPWCRMQERKVLLRAYEKCYHEELCGLFDSQLFAHGSTRHKVKYSIGSSRLSGSAETSTLNTFTNALVAYVALRESGFDVKSSLANLGLYGGDDGITCNVDLDSYKTVCSNLGLITKTEVVRSGPVTFLGRVYLDPWLSTDSIIDFKRCLSKFHYTCSQASVPTSVVLLRKAVSLHVTDCNTPFLGELAFKIMLNSRVSLKTALVGDDTSYFSKDYLKEVGGLSDLLNSDSSLYPIFPLVNVAAAEEYIKDTMNLDDATFKDLLNQVEAITDINNIRIPFPDQEPIKVAVVSEFRDEIIFPPGVIDIPPVPALPLIKPDVAQTVLKDIVAGSKRRSKSVKNASNANPVKKDSGHKQNRSAGWTDKKKVKPDNAPTVKPKNEKFRDLAKRNANDKSELTHSSPKPVPASRAKGSKPT